MPKMWAADVPGAIYIPQNLRSWKARHCSTDPHSHHDLGRLQRLQAAELHLSSLPLSHLRSVTANSTHTQLRRYSLGDYHSGAYSAALKSFCGYHLCFLGAEPVWVKISEDHPLPIVTAVCSDGNLSSACSFVHRVNHVQIPWITFHLSDWSSAAQHHFVELLLFSRQHKTYTHRRTRLTEASTCSWPLGFAYIKRPSEVDPRRPAFIIAVLQMWRIKYIDMMMSACSSACGGEKTRR